MVKVLVVDDELDFCNSLEETLSREGYQAIVATSGPEAIEKVKTQKPHLILLDIHMPQMDGLQTLERIRQIDRGAVVIMITVVKDYDSVRKAIKLGAVNYMTKPLNLDLLKRCLKNWATQIQVKEFAEANILALDYDAEKFKTILELFTKKGYNIKYIQEKNANSAVEQGSFDLLILRQDVLGEEAMDLLGKYKQAYPELPIVIALEKESSSESMDRIRSYGKCGYLPAPFNISGLIAITYGMMSKSKERVNKGEEKEPGDYILIVDDESDVCEYTAKYLSRERYKVCVVSDPKAALGQVEALKPSIVLLDIVMPGVDGLELLKKIKKINPQIRVIMMTAVKDESVCREAIESGASDYLVKPFSLDQLKVTIFINNIKLHHN